MNSSISEMPGPEVGVNARAPFHIAPITTPIADSSAILRLHDHVIALAGLWIGPVPRTERAVTPSISEVDGVIGYQAPTVAPA